MIDSATDTDATVCADDAAAAPTQSLHRLVSGGNEYQYLLHSPTAVSAPVPLVLNFHGLGGDGAGQAAYSAYADLADAEGFAVVHPSGLGAEDSFGVRSWELPHSDTPARNDVQFVSDLIDQVADQACIDQSRVYATGFSNGGYFSAHLACELADRIAATFSVAGISHPEGCAPARPVAMAAIHGTADSVVPFHGGESSLLKGAKIDDGKTAQLEEFFAQVMPDELAEFATAFGCTGVTESAVDAETTLTRYTECDGGVEMRFYAVEGGGHIWPGSSWSKDGDESKSGESANADVHATADGWAFMSQYSLDD